MKKIEFVGGIADELARVIADNNISAICTEGNVCEISDQDLEVLKKVAAAAIDGNDIVIIGDTDLEKEIEKLGYRYEDNEDGTFDVCYDHAQDSYFGGSNKHHVATVRATKNSWFVDNKCGLGEGEYSKADWTLADAIKDQCIDDLF